TFSQTAQRHIIALLRSVRRTTREVEMATDGKISLAVGDGVGRGIPEARVRVLQAAAARSGLDLALTPYPIGWKAYEESRSTLTPETVAGLRNHMGWILGPTFAGESPKDDPIKGHPSGYLRRNFALFANVRPVQAWPQLKPLIDTFRPSSPAARPPACSTAVSELRSPAVRPPRISVATPRPTRSRPQRSPPSR